jgi:hypothetical protein
VGKVNGGGSVLNRGNLGASCPKCGAPLVLVNPDGTPLVNGSPLGDYAFAQCPVCGIEKRIESNIKPTDIKPTDIKPTEIRPTEIVPTEIGPSPTTKVQKSFSHNFLRTYLPAAILIICLIIGTASFAGWITLPHISLPNGGGGGSAYDGTYAFTGTAKTYSNFHQEASIYGSFTIQNGKSTTSGFTGTVDANGNWKGVYNVIGSSIAMTGVFNNSQFVLDGSNSITVVSITVTKS